MAKKKPPSQPARPGDEIPRKTDGVLRRLLEKTDARIRKDVERESERLEKKRQEILESIIRLPPTATEAERQAARRVRKARLAELMPHRDLIPVIPGAMKPVRIRAIVRFTGNRADLEAMGIEVRSQAQDVFTIVGTQKQLRALEKRPSCRRLRSPRILLSTVEDACAQAEITAVHAPRAVNPTGFRGNGILVGIIDSPLDVTHHGLRDPTAGGTHDSRVLYYWAQSTHTQNAAGDTVRQDGPPGPPGQTPEQFTNAAPSGARPDFAGLDYGRLYTNDFINTAIGTGTPYGTGNNQICCEPTTDNEHGTHCAGIAAGSGHVTNWNTNPNHIGAAPAAQIVYVRIEPIWQAELDSGAALEDAYLDGIQFCLECARFEGMPIVISVSRGTNFGPHNGSTDFDQFRDNLVNSFDNRCIVWSAGNDNSDDGYRTGTVASGSATDSFTLTVTRSGAGGAIVITNVWLDIWYTGPELDYRVEFGGNDTGWRTAGQDYAGTVTGRDIEAERDIETVAGLRCVRIWVGNARTTEVYTVELRNPHASQAATYHAWTGLQGWYAALSGPTHDELTLSDTGCGKSILTVGACDKARPPNPATGELITLYSGAGPTLDGRIKPEIVAVGGTADDPATAVDEYDPVWSAASDLSSGYIDKIGTSMATPLVAGAVACLLEEYHSPPPVGLNIDLNQDTVKALLTQYANTLNLHLDPSQPGFVQRERNLYGYGRLRMIGPIDHIIPPVDNDLWVRTAADDYGETPYPGGCFCHAPDVRVFQAGTDNETTRIDWGTIYDVRVTVRNLGIQDAVNATVRLRYTLPHAAPADWVDAEDASDNALVNTAVTVPAMDAVEVEFHWRPEAAELGAPAGTTHFCLLAEVDHVNDPLVYTSPSMGGGTAWATNIKGTNNVALRNLHIE